MAKTMTASEATSDLISRTVKVNRTRSPRDALKATGYTVDCNDDVIKVMPNGQGEKVEVIFFVLDRWVSEDELEKEYELRGLVPADLYLLAAANESDPTFGDDHPNGTHWKDSKGEWCFAAFRRWYGERRVRVGRNGGRMWDNRWFFAGVRK